MKINECEYFNGECEMSDLKPCPFCGIEPMTFNQTGLIICSYAMCGVNPESKSKEDWNKRTDDRLEQENADLNHRVKDLSACVGVSVARNNELKQESAELREFNKKLLQELCDIQSQCIGELTMGYKLGADSVGCSISQVTGMTNPELIKHLELLNK